jgi:hypothetical protein
MACTGSNVCVNNACKPSGTQSCTGCQNGTVCNNGTCSTTIDPNAMFKMIVTDVHLAATDNGEEWDEFNANPCPFICVSFTYNGTAQTACNSYCSGTYDCMPPAPANLIGNTSGSDPATSPVYIPGSVIIAGGLSITAYDYDTFSSNDVGGQVTFPATSTWMSTFSTGVFDSVTNVSFQLQ